MKTKLLKIYKDLLKIHGPQGWWPLNNIYEQKNKTKQLTKDEKFEISLGAILTQNTSWKNVEKALENLRTHNTLNKEGIQNIQTDKLTKLIKPSGYHNQKTKKLKIFADFLDSKKQINRENLLTLWGIGPETADSILLYAHRKPIFVVDVYTKRVFSNLGFFKPDETYDKVQKLFMNNLSQDHLLFNEFHALIVEHTKILKKHYKRVVKTKTFINSK
tara:strand:+ start:904 stop:1554 length:651 start_codon:yes stop_codon:yes gene_type:complete